MRDPARIDRVLAALRAEWLAQPDIRLTQLVINATGVSAGVGSYQFTRLYCTEDEDVLAGLEAMAARRDEHANDR